MSAGQLPLRMGLRDSSVFASYFAGRNRPTVEALLSLGTHVQPTCVWLHGPRACGKTHLLQASCVRWSERGEPCAYLPLRELIDKPDVLSGYGELSLVAIDDIDLAAGQSQWEHGLFRLHQALEEHGGRLLVASSSLPALVGYTLRDLASRLNGGLVLTLQNLSDDEQHQALQLRAQLRGFELPQDTVQFLQRRLPRDMESLCAFLDHLDEASLVAQRRLTVPFVREVLEHTKDLESD
jgi:DnaA-homolog protein